MNTYDNEATQYQNTDNETTQFENTTSKQNDNNTENPAGNKDVKNDTAKGKGWRNATIGAASGLLIGGIATVAMGKSSPESDNATGKDELSHPEWGDLRYDEVRKAMSQSKCRNKMMFVDACRSGGMRVDNTSAQSAIAAAKNANVMLFLSSRNNESSIERGDMQNGFFTTYLQKGLRGNADTNRDRTITAKELYDFVHNGVSKISGNKQHPVMWGKFCSNMPVMRW